MALAQVRGVAPKYLVGYFEVVASVYQRQRLGLSAGEFLGERY